MGILNVSPDSFSGDGLAGDPGIMASRAKKMVDDGADIIDVGGESTRPGAMPVSVEEEIRRVIPVIARLGRELGIPLSIDTYKAEVARLAIEAGVGMINDVCGLNGDPGMARVAAAAGVPVVIVSNQRNTAIEGDIMAAVISDLRESIQVARDAGMVEENIIIDPGIGFGKSPRQNREIVRRLAELKVFERPILLGTSRKFMIDLSPERWIEATEASIAIGIAGGADIVRVHDVKEMARVCRMSDAITRKLKGTK
ncbi:MAG: dihydropteroate synthase [Chloroflexi bacterium]|nr:dihydropteroate synthase [Chloroflexota bacterium]